MTAHAEGTTQADTAAAVTLQAAARRRLVHLRLEAAAPAWPTSGFAAKLELDILFAYAQPMPGFGLGKLRALAHSLARRVQMLEKADPGPRCSLLAIGDGLLAEAGISGRGGHAVDRPFGSTPILRFLGAYLKRVEKAGWKLVACETDKYHAFANAIARHGASELDVILGNLYDLGLLRRDNYCASGDCDTYSDHDDCDARDYDGVMDLDVDYDSVDFACSHGLDDPAGA